MKYGKLNYFLNLALIVAFFVTSLTGLIFFFFLPKGVSHGKFVEFLGVMKMTWCSLHQWVGVVMIVLLIIHFVIHAKWIVRMTRKIFAVKK